MKLGDVTHLLPQFLWNGVEFFPKSYFPLSYSMGLSVMNISINEFLLFSSSHKLVNNIMNLLVTEPSSRISTNIVTHKSKKLFMKLGDVPPPNPLWI